MERGRENRAICTMMPETLKKGNLLTHLEAHIVDARDYLSNNEISSRERINLAADEYEDARKLLNNIEGDLLRERLTIDEERLSALREDLDRLYLEIRESKK